MELIYLLLMAFGGVFVHVLKKQQQTEGMSELKALQEYFVKNFSATLLMVIGVGVTVLMTFGVEAAWTREAAISAFTMGVAGNSFFNRMSGKAENLANGVVKGVRDVKTP